MYLSVNSHCKAVVFITKISFTFSRACNFPQVMSRSEFVCMCVCGNKSESDKEKERGGGDGGGGKAVRNEEERICW